jgi:hypothetical protein
MVGSFEELGERLRERLRECGVTDEAMAVRVLVEWE